MSIIVGWREEPKLPDLVGRRAELAVIEHLLAEAGAGASATDSRSDPDRCAWHRAQAVLGTDEVAAAELERSADRARARGGVAAAAAFLEHAAVLTPEPIRRAGRALEAAHAKHEVGASEAALELLTVAADGPLDALQRARLELLRAGGRRPG